MPDERLPTVSQHFGAGWVKGLNNFFPDLPPDERVKILGLLDACPNPAAVVKKNGLDWTINRYTECNLVDGLLMEKADKINPTLAQKLRKSYIRPIDENPRNIDPNAIPKMYRLMILSGTGAVRYAASRIVIEQFGREPQWKIGDPRVSKGMQILETALKESSEPEEFLAKLADGLTSTDADATMDKVLGHIFAEEFQEEGQIFLAKKVALAVKEFAPALWEHYLSLTDEQMKLNGITTVSLEN